MQPQRNEVVGITTLLEGWSKVVRVTYRQRDRNGVLRLQDRDLLDRGDGVTVLLHNRERRTVILLRQPRIVATLLGDPIGETIEACNGLVSNETPAACALREVQEETGFSPLRLSFIASVYASPGGSLERIHLFLAEYDESSRISTGGGLPHEGEDIEVLEVPFDTAIEWVRQSAIIDGRTILVIQHLQLSGLMDNHAPPR